MMKTFIIATSMLFISFSSFSQEAPAPEYMAHQDFPDSVQQVLLTKLDGEKIKFLEMLQAYKGRKIVIDYWASWCRDCIGGLPKVKDLQNITKNKNVVYIFLSLDREEDKWKAAIDRYKIDGEHFWIEAGWKNPLSNYVVLDWIPRYILINEEGKVSLAKATTANDPGKESVILKNKSRPERQ